MRVWRPCSRGQRSDVRVQRRSLTFVDKDEDLGQEEGGKVPAVEVEEHLQGRGRELGVGGVKVHTHTHTGVLSTGGQNTSK